MISDLDERKALETAAALMAAQLLELDTVRAVQLYDVPQFVDGPSPDAGPVHRLLVLVDDELLQRYYNRLSSSVVTIDPDGEERDETNTEAILYLLGTTEESFYEQLGEEHPNTDIDFHDVRVEGLIELMLMPENWTESAASLLERLHRSSLPGSPARW